MKLNTNFFLMFIHFLRDQERQSVSGGGAERKGDTESEGGSRLWAVSTEPDVGLELTSCGRSRPELKSDAYRPTDHPTHRATQAHQLQGIFKRIIRERHGQKHGGALFLSFTSQFNIYLTSISTHTLTHPSFPTTEGSRRLSDLLTILA